MTASMSAAALQSSSPFNSRSARTRTISGDSYLTALVPHGPAARSGIWIFDLFHRMGPPIRVAISIGAFQGLAFNGACWSPLAVSSQCKAARHRPACLPSHAFSLGFAAFHAARSQHRSTKSKSNGRM